MPYVSGSRHAKRNYIAVAVCLSAVLLFCSRSWLRSTVIPALVRAVASSTLVQARDSATAAALPNLDVDPSQVQEDQTCGMDYAQRLHEQVACYASSSATYSRAKPTSVAASETSLKRLRLRAAGWQSAATLSVPGTPSSDNELHYERQDGEIKCALDYDAEDGGQASPNRTYVVYRLSCLRQFRW